MDLWSLAELGDGLIDESVLATTALLLQGHEVECKLMSETAPIRRSGLLGGQSLPRASSFGVSHLKSGVDVRLLEHDAYLERCSSDKTIGDILCTCSKCDKESAIAAVRTRAKLSLVDTPHPTTHQTALYIAALHGNQDFIAHLLQQGGNVNALNTDGQNALHGAVKRSPPSESLVQSLIESNCNPNQASFDDDHITPLILASGCCECPEIIRVLLRVGEFMSVERSQRALNAMKQAVEKRHFANLEVFLQLLPSSLLAGDVCSSYPFTNIPSLCVVLEYQSGLVSRQSLDKAFQTHSTFTSKRNFLDGVFRTACSSELLIVIDFLRDKKFDWAAPLGSFCLDCTFHEDSKLNSVAYSAMGTPLEVALSACEDRKKRDDYPNFCIIKELLRLRVPTHSVTCRLINLLPKPILLEFIEATRSDNGVLDLERACIRFLPGDFVAALFEYNITNKKKITLINLQGNKLQAIPSEMTRIPSLKDINLKDNPVVELHSQRGWKEISSILRESEERQRKWNHSTIMLIGNLKGVRSLWKGLPQEKTHRQRFRSTLTKPSDEERFEILRGMQIHKSNPTSYDIWRLQGAHSGFFPSSSLFITPHSIFLLAVSMADLIGAGASVELQNINSWLQKINQLTKNVKQIPTIIVLFEDDRETGSNSFDMAQSLLQRFAKYKNMQETLVITSKSDGMEDLKRAIQTATRRATPEAKEVAWVQLYDILHLHAKKPWKGLRRSSSQVEVGAQSSQSSSKNGNLINLEWKDYLALAEACMVREPFEALHFLSLTGTVIVCFELEEPFIILDIAWLDATVHSLAACEGSLSIPKLQEYFPDSSITLCQRFIGLLRSRSLCVKANFTKSDSSLPSACQQYLVPSMLPDNPVPEDLCLHWPQKDSTIENEYHRIYKLSLVPEDFFARVLVELLHLPEIIVHLLWKKGLILSYTLVGCPCSSYPCKQSASVHFNTDGEYLISLSVRCCHVSHRLLRMVSSALLNMIEDSKLADSITRYVPCSHCIQSNFSNIYRFRYDTCIDKVANNRQFVYCAGIQSTSRRVSILSLAPDVMFASIPRFKPSEVTMGRLLGEGGFGKVFLGEIQKTPNVSIRVAIKEPHQGTETSFVYDPIMYDEFMKEVQIMFEVRHPNIVELIGVTFKPLRMILEFVESGDLFELLHNSSDDLSWRLRLMIAWDVARGMRFLQEHSPPIVHRDLHSHNIFISSLSLEQHQQRAKIADFGLARGVVRHASFALSDIWLAPEILSGEIYNSQSDVYSFGICCWEIATRQVPFHTFKHVSFLPDAIVRQELRPSLELLKNSGAPPQFMDLVVDCWDSDPKKRPSFHQVVCRLSSILEVKDNAEKAVIRGSLAVSHSRSHSPQNSTSMKETAAQRAELKFWKRLSDLVRQDLVVTCATKRANELWIGTSRGDIIVVDALNCSIVATKKAHSAGVLQILHINGSKYDVIVSCTTTGHIRVWRNQEMIKETKIAKDCKIKEMALTPLPNGVVGIAVIINDAKGRTFIINYEVMHLVEQSSDGYDQLPVIGYQTDERTLRTVFLLHPDGNISLEVSSVILPLALSKIDYFYLNNQLASLCPSIKLSLPNGAQLYIADGSEIHEYFLTNGSEPNSTMIHSNRVDYYNSPICSFAIIDLPKAPIYATQLWSGHESGCISIWAISTTGSGNASLRLDFEVDQSLTPHRTEVLFISQVGESIYSISKDGVIASWSLQYLAKGPKVSI